MLREQGVLAQGMETANSQCMMQPEFSVAVPSGIGRELSSLRTGFLTAHKEYYHNPYRTIIDWRTDFYENATNRLLLCFRTTNCGDTYNRIFGKEANNSYSQDGSLLWESMAINILKSEKDEGVKWEKTKVKVSSQYLLNFLNNYLADYNMTFNHNGGSGSIGSCLEAIGNKTWPIYPTDKLDGYEFTDPNMLYSLATNHIFRKGYADVLERIREEGLLDPLNTKKYTPLYSFIAERFFREERFDEFWEFLDGVYQSIGSQAGAGVITAIRGDLEKQYFPRGTPFYIQNGNSVQRKHLDTLKLSLSYAVYSERTPIIEPAMLEKAIAAATEKKDPFLFWEEIFLQAGIKSAMDNLFGEEERKKIEAIYDAAGREKKVISGLVLVFADMFGYNPETARWLAALMQLQWGAIVAIDDVVDQHTGERKGRIPISESKGLGNAIETPMKAVAKIWKNILKRKDLDDNVLAVKFADMLDISCEGDEEARSLGWDDKEEKYVAAMKKTIKAFSWLPKYFGDYRKIPETGMAFEKYIENLWCLMLFNNDFEDKYAWETGKHDSGNDIGNRITLPVWQLMRLPEEAVPQSVKDTIRSAYERIGRKKLKGEALDAQDRELIQSVSQIIASYHPVAARALEPIMLSVYDEARQSLSQAQALFPFKNDVRNQFYFALLNNSLEAIWLQLQKHMEEDHN